MKKPIKILVLCVCLSLTFVFMTGCGSEEKKALDEAVTAAEDTGLTVKNNIDRMECIAIEDGVAYWDVYLTENTEWDGFGNQDFVIKVAKECIGKQENADADYIDISGYESNGNMAFATGYVSGNDKIVFYKENKYDADYLLMPEELNELGW